MTEAEARRNFIEATINAGAGVYVDIDTVAEMLRIEEEIQQYRAIGTVEEFKDLKEKQIPKKPVIIKERGLEIEYKCPVCGLYVIEMRPIENYCRHCGQKLDSEV